MAPLAFELARLVAVAAVVGGAVLIAGGGNGFWLCLPGVLLVSAWSQSRAVALLSAAVVVAVAAAVAVSSSTRPSWLLVVLVPAASVAVLLTMRERMERERDALRADALTDALTGVANRRSLLGRMEYEIARHTRGRRSFVLVMLDLDGFKLLNDRFGHPAGDQLLRDVSAALEHAMRDQDTVARIGGDEFCVLAPETDRDGARQLTARAIAAVSHVTAGVDSLGAGAGASIFPDDGATAAELLHAADQRLLAAKRRSRRGRQYRRAA
jgi:diguanylate cyclase (GGDEF)-like protein